MAFEPGRKPNPDMAEGRPGTGTGVFGKCQTRAPTMHESANAPLGPCPVLVQRDL